jgi:CHAT domain-containing protein
LAAPLLAATIALTALAAEARRPFIDIARLAQSMPEPRERLARVPHGRVNADVSNDVTTWPAEALQSVHASLQRAGASDVADARLAAAIAFFRRDCAGSAATLAVALREFPANPSLLNDAAAAHACIARRSPDLSGAEAVRAAEAALATIDVRPEWPEPWTNLAAAYSVLGLAELAHDAIGHAVILESDNTRRRTLEDEARRLIRPSPDATPAPAWDGLLTDAVVVDEVRLHPQRSREALESQLLPQWALAVESGGSTTIFEANLASAAGARASLFGDVLMSDVVRTLVGSEGTRRSALARGFLAYAEGRSLYEAGDRERAGVALVSAGASLTAAGNAFEHEARLQHGIVLYQLRQLDAADQEVQHVLAVAERHQYRALANRALWILALIDMQQGRIENAVTRHLDAIRGYEAIDETENAAAVANSAADTLRIAGDESRGWPMLARAARALPHLSNLQRRYLILFNLSLYAQDEGSLRAAEVFESAALDAADRRGNRLTMIESRLRRARLRVARGHFARARLDLQSARTMIDMLQSPASAAYLRAWQERVQAQIDARTRPASAATEFERLAPDFERTEPAELPSLFLEAGRAALRSGTRGRAEANFDQGLSVVLHRRDRLRSPEFRLGYLSAAWDLFHSMIGLRFRYDPLGALAIAETARAALLGTFSARVPVSASVPALRTDSALIYFSVLTDRVLVWTFTATGVSSRVVPYTQDDLAWDVDAFRQAVRTDRRGAAEDAIGARLYARLIAPAFAGGRTHLERLLITPDGPIGDIPFGALRDPVTHQLLATQLTIQMVPFMPQSIPDVPARTVRLLAVGYDGGGAGLSKLEAAEREASLVGALYPNSRVIVGAGAGPDAVRTAAAAADIIHLAAHARANRLMPWNAQLFLAPSGANTSGAVTGEDIEHWPLSNCRLVVLSACETALGSRTRGQGVVNLAAPFLSAGARVVIGTLWPVDDRGSEMFTTRLHRYLARGLSPGSALRATQLDALAAEDPTLSAPSLWAAYVALTRTIQR